MEDKKMRYLIICLISLLLLGCSQTEKELMFKKTEVTMFGDKDENKPGTIGEIGFMAINKNQDVYIIDLGYKKIKKYSKNGIFIRDYGNGEGRGPGEFIYPFSIDVDSENNIYVTDLTKREMVVIDSSNQVKIILKTKYEPSNVVVTEPGIVYISGMPASNTGKIIYKYDLNREKNYELPILKFCDRIDPNGNDILKYNIARDGMIKDNNGNIYYSFPFPYEIRVYNENGEYLNKYIRNIKTFIPPYTKQENNRTVTAWENSIVDPMIINERLMCIRVFQNALEKEYYDFYNTKTHSYIGLINSNSLGIEQVSTIKSDSQGYIYYSQNEPYPHIVKMKLELLNDAE